MRKAFSDPVVKFFISAIGIVIIFSVLRILQHIFIPFVIAYFLYFIFEPLNNYLKKYRVPYYVAILADIVIVVFILFGISRVIFTSFSKFGEQLPFYEQKLNSIVRNTSESVGITDPAFIQFELLDTLSKLDYGGLAGDFFTTTLSFFSTVFFVLVFYIFVSSGHTRLVNVIKDRYVQKNVDESVKELKEKMTQESTEKENSSTINDKIAEVKQKKAQEIENTFKNITSQVQRYIIVKFFISLFTGLLSALILYLFDIDFFIVWAVLTFLLNFIPSVGSIIAVVMPTLITLVQYESFGYTIIVVAVLVGIQATMGNLVEPKAFGDRLGMNPLVVIFSLLIWGYIWGIVGMFLSVPLTAIAKIVMASSNSENLKFISKLME
jgi:predicted PurR-regulated permease PerM